MTSLIRIPFADSGDKAIVPENDASGGVNMTNGYGQAYSLDPATDPSAKRIEREMMNGLFNLITSAIKEMQALGVTPFITSDDNSGSAFSYNKGAMTFLDGIVYQSLADGNTTTPPSELWATLANLNNALSRDDPFGDIKSDGKVNTALANLGLGNIATPTDINAGTAKKLVDAYGLINAITTMQDVQDGALRKFVNALTLKNYLPVKSLAANGFIRIPDVPGGTIIQWGQVTGSINEGVQNVVLPTPFPNSGRLAMAIPLNVTGDATCDIFAQLQSMSLTGINFFFSWVSSSTPGNGFQWFAIGY